MNVSIIKHYDCHEIVNRLSTDCHAYPADCHHWALRFRVSFFKSAHFSRSFFQFRPCRPMAPMRPMIAPWSPHDRPMIAPWSPVHLQVATVKNAKKICTCKIFSNFAKFELWLFFHCSDPKFDAQNSKKCKENVNSKCKLLLRKCKKM